MTFLPFFTCLFWLVLNPFIHKKERPLRILQLLIACLGLSTLSEAELTYGCGREQIIFYFIRQFVTIMIIPVAVIYIQAVEQPKKRTYALVWASVPASMSIAQIALLMTYGSDMFLDCVTTHTNILTLGKEQTAIEFLIHLSSFWIFYGVLTVELIAFGVYTILRATRGTISIQHRSILAVIIIYTVTEAMQLSHSTVKTWISVIMLLIMSVAIYLMAFTTLLDEKADISFSDFIRMSLRLVPGEKKADDRSSGKKKITTIAPVIEIQKPIQPDDNYLKTKFEELIIGNKLYLKKGIRVADVAKILVTNRTYISKLVNDTYGMSFSDYINTLRIRYAQEYLVQNPDAKQSDMAATCGFPDASAFNNAFKKITGVTPKIWLATKQ